MDQESVLKTIDLAFSETTRPDSHSLVVEDGGPEAFQVRGLLLSRQWPDLDIAALDAYDDHADLSAIFAFLDPRAAIYFMPAFLRYIVSKGTSNGLLFRNLLRRITAGKEPFNPTSFRVDQRDAISRVMAYMEQVFERDDAFDLTLVRECRTAWANSLAKLDVGP